MLTTSSAMFTFLPPLLSVAVTVIVDTCEFDGTVKAPWNSPVELTGNGPKLASGSLLSVSVTCEVTSPYVLTPQPLP